MGKQRPKPPPPPPPSSKKANAFCVNVTVKAEDIRKLLKLIKKLDKRIRKVERTLESK